MSGADARPTSSAPQDSALRSMMSVYESRHHSVVAARVQGGETTFLSTGPDRPTTGPETAPERRIFEIGSITKVFAGILLCLLVEEGRVDPKAPLREMSKALDAVPSWIAPEHLTAHISGIPTLPVPLWRALFRQHPEGPYAAFSRADLLAWLRAWRGTPPAGRPRHAYSNLGVGLLGEAVALREGLPFDQLLIDRLLRPLGLEDTAQHLNPEQQSQFVQPRHRNGQAVSAWTFQAAAAAGCLRSSATDLARFAQGVIQAIREPDTALDRAICRSAQPILGLGRRGSLMPRAQCHGWLAIHYAPAAPRFLFHNGATAGSTAALYICPEKAEACAILSNNGVAANLWGSLKLEWVDPIRQAHRYFSLP